jgi:hypothetical protein
METPAPVKSKHKTETPDITVVTDRVYYAGASLPGFPGHAAEAFYGEVKKIYQSPSFKWGPRGILYIFL